MITGSDRKEIGILRAVGWSIKDVITLKVAEIDGATSLRVTDQIEYYGVSRHIKGQHSMRLLFGIGVFVASLATSCTSSSSGRPLPGSGPTPRRLSLSPPRCL